MNTTSVRPSQWLVQQLAGGPRSRAELFQAAKRAGVSRSSLYRLKGELDIQVRRRPEFAAGTEWSLPEGFDAQALAERPSAAQTAEAVRSAALAKIMRIRHMIEADALEEADLAGMSRGERLAYQARIDGLTDALRELTREYAARWI